MILEGCPTACVEQTEPALNVTEANKLESVKRDFNVLKRFRFDKGT